MSLTRRALALVKSPAAVYLGSSVLARIGSFLLIPLYTRRLSLEEYGDYALFLTIVALLSTFVSGGLVAAVPKFFFSESDRAVGKTSAASVARWLAIVSLGAGAALAAIVALFVPERGVDLLARWSLLLVVASSVGMAVSAVPSTLLRAEQRAYAASGFQLAQFAITTGAGLILVAYFDRGYRGSIEAAAIGNVASGSLGLAYIVLLPRGGMRISALGRALVFSLPFVPHFVAQWAQSASDRWVLRATGYEAELGAYSLASQLITPVNMVIYAWNDASSPRVGEHYRAGGADGIRAQLPRVRRSYLLAVIGPGVALSLALPVIALVVGERFRESLFMVPVLLLTLIPDALYFANHQLLYYAGRTRALGMATVVAAVVNVGANIALVPAFGVWGSIVARFLGASLRAAIVTWVARSVVGGPSSTVSDDRAR